jgi:[acyl-carrier-protein] S-malonyltransferase
MTTAFIFPGQGSQSIGMMSTLAQETDVIRQTFDQASAVLGYDLWQLVSEGPAEQLNATEFTQPAMLTADVASWRAWQAGGGDEPAYMAGHSLGEYSALVCAEALDFGSAVSLVADRARYMQQAVPEGQGAMAAIIGLDDAAVVQLCRAQAGDEVLQPVNFNAPGQVVVAGSSDAVARLLENAKDAGAKRALPLPVSVPSHCDLMQPASERMRERLQQVDLTMPRIPVLHNVNVEVATDIDQLRDLLARQISQPVRWVETIQRMAGDGVTTVVECGPGKVLCGLNRRIERNMNCIALLSSADIETARQA